MPCITTDSNYYIPYKPDTSPLPDTDASTLYYRPYHMLSGYRTQAQFWLSQYKPDDFSANRTVIPFDFETALRLTWASLGHDGLDGDPSSKSADDLYSSITAQLSFVGLEAFDVDRGLWDVKNPRNLQLRSQAPEYLKSPFMKTVKLLLAYGVDLTIELPVAITAADISNQNKIISLLGMPITQRDTQKNELHVSVGNNAYPVLLAVLAQEI